MNPEPLPVAILAGGLATRLGQLTQRMPKALIDINGEPFVAHQLRLLQHRGVKRVVLCVGYLGEMIRDKIGDGEDFGLEIHYSFDAPRLLGTAGAVKKALPLLGNAFFILYGDAYLDCDYDEVAHAFRDSGKLALMTIYRNEGRWDKSNVECSNGTLIAYDKERPTERMRHIDYGLGAFKRSAFNNVSVDEPYDLAAVYRCLLERKQLAAFEIGHRFYEIGSLQGVEETRRHLSSRGT
jgi:N-acetyl-alpha-D-muramate 1-phosphate uridylyltransferase